ncbi:MAG: hypothetical protein ACREOS_13305, partial [Candidatus Dormibacteraceae bacterium]
MPLLARNITLLALDRFTRASGGRVRGKTLLQKQLFFVGEIAGIDLGYRAHYYGPYSDTLADAVIELKNLGFVREYGLGSGRDSENGSPEARRYDYELTDEGKSAVSWLQSRYPGEATRVVQAAERILNRGNPDRSTLIYAAKTLWIIHEQKRSMTSSEVAEQAQRFAWPVGEEQA